MSVLVFLEHHGGEVQKGSLAVLSKAASLGGANPLCPPPRPPVDIVKEHLALYRRAPSSAAE